MGNYPTLGQKKTPFLGPGMSGAGESPRAQAEGSGVSNTGEWLPVQKNEAVFDRHAHQPGHVKHIQLGHQIGAVLFDRFLADL